ncbi:hypothetical protein [Aquibium sp. ELW1220]|nr:hypothetical protein [Aquibium sp. ELW1220]MDN2579184.1 hypothetical protein [Aquibium sp. ELW1220]
MRMIRATKWLILATMGRALLKMARLCERGAGAVLACLRADRMLHR